MSDVIALVRMGRPPWGRVAASVVLGVTAVLAGVGLMGLAGYVISRAAEHPPVLELSVAIVAIRACGIARPLARYGERLVTHDLAFRVLARTRVAVYRALEPLVPSRTAGRRQGDLLAAIVGDVDATQNLYVRGLAPPLVAVCSGLVCVWGAAAILPAAGAVLAAGLVLAGVGVPLLAAALGRSTGARQASARAELTAELVELLRGAPELVVCGREEEVLGRVDRLDGELLRLGRRSAVSSGVVEGLLALLTGLTVVTVLWVSTRAVADGSLDRVLLAVLVLGAMASFESVAPLPAAALVLDSTLASVRRLVALTAARPDVTDPVEPAALPVRTEIAADDVAVDTGDGGSWGLQHADLRLPADARVALVGPSGAGKSTVAALMVRFLDPDHGQVLLGGVDMRRLRPADVRTVVTLDAQEAYLFSTSIRENVRLARPRATDSEVEAALASAGLGDWVGSLPDGADTSVGDEGADVSGGERRRITLARALLADSRVVVLDEPTAHLDHETAVAVMDDVHRACTGRSMLLITHRPEGLDRVDAVLRLTHGRIELDTALPLDRLTASREERA